jgi:acetoin utilization protein AcuB
MEKGKLVGIITFRNLIEAAPSSATSLSIFELNHLILKIKVKDLMKKKVITVSPEDSVMDVIALGMRHNIGGFPVLDERGELVGIVTETHISQAMLQLFGTNVKEEIIHLENVELQPGAFGKIVAVVEKLGVTIYNMFFSPKRTTDLMRVYIRIKAEDGAKERVEEALQQAGYIVEK